AADSRQGTGTRQQKEARIEFKDMDSRERDHSLTIARSCDLDIPVSFKIDAFEGKRRKKPYSQLLQDPATRFASVQQDLPSDLYIICQLWADNKPLTIPFRTAHKNFKDRYVWNEIITLPIRYKDLPLSSQLIFTLYDFKGPPASTSASPVGGTTLRLFGKTCTLKKGKQRMQLWPDREADASIDSSTPSKVPGQEKDERGRLEKIMEKQKRKDIPSIDWLDKLAFREIERIHAEESAKSDKLFLYVDLPRFDLPVIFGEIEYPLPSLPVLVTSATANATAAPTVSTPASATVFAHIDTGLFSVVDPDIARDNPVEAKHLRLVRSHRSGPLDREMKPNAITRDELNSILDYPPTQALNSTESNLLWQFRFYLTRDKRALTKFLKSVRWSDRDEVKQAVDVLLPMWSEIEIGDALELLGPGEAFRDRRVRGFAVKQIARADDEELMLYLLQLVQALKFEPPLASASTSATSRLNSRRDTALKLANATNLQTLEDFLIDRAVTNPVLGNNFHWYLMVEIEDKMVGKMYGRTAYHFMMKIAEQDGGNERRETLRRQGEFVITLSKLAKELRTSKDTRPRKIEKLKAHIHDPKMKLGTLPTAIPLPLDANLSILGIDADQSTIFKSNLFPLKLQLLCSGGNQFPVIFKNGDDLRQDQLVIQLFTLMDKLLRKENLDLKITPYRVLATGAIDGMVQFVPSKTLGAIASEYQGSLLNYLREEHPDDSSSSTFGVSPVVLDTFVRSCAGYCVVTYLLGVGDRHLDNLLLSPDGHFFHVDFGYILGRDPKPFPPAVKVCKEMVDAMGGTQSPHYLRFKSLCYTAFIGLRKNANLIINLISLMIDANIPDIKLEPDKAVSKVQDKFRLDLSEEEAIKHFESLLNETSAWTSVLDRIHAAAQYWRT
ncbi:MAG: Phosphatidylinositol (PI) 3-kinase, partial [Cyphobasidiales sp. Tagirdzhanova-0007]